MPNYPSMKIHPGYQNKFYFKEIIDGIEVHRAWIFVSTSKSIFMRLLNYFSFVFTSMLIGLVRTGPQNVIMCESPPLFLGMSAWLIKVVKGGRFVFNVSDLWPESAEKLGLVTNKMLLDLSQELEEFLYRSADLITGQTQGIVKNISARMPKADVYWIPNGVDVSYYDIAKVKSTWRADNGFAADDLLLAYAGIIGHAQGLEIIIQCAALVRSTPSIKFLMIGNGPEKEKLIALNEALGNTNVHFYDFVPKTAMPNMVAAINAAVIPLRKLDLFKGAIPSKIFENLAMQKPILLGVEGEAYDLFIRDGECGLAFEPENVSDLARCVMQLHDDSGLIRRLGENGVKYVRNKFNRNDIALNFTDKLKQSFQTSTTGGEA